MFGDTTLKMLSNRSSVGRKLNNKKGNRVRLFLEMLDITKHHRVVVVVVKLKDKDKLLVNSLTSGRLCVVCSSTHGLAYMNYYLSQPG